MGTLRGDLRGEVGATVKVLVTGAGGFVGRHVVTDLLNETTWKIIALDRHGSRLPRESTRLRTIGDDLDLPGAPQETPWLDDVDAIVNLASSSDVSAFLTNSVKHTVNNVMSTLNLLEWARGRKLQAFVQVSTNEVYGPRDVGLRYETDELRPSTPYSASKAAQEMLAIGWRQTYGVPVIIVNTAHVFGEGQPRQRFVPTTIDKILDGEPVPIYRYAQGAPIRNWTYAGDLARAIRSILTSGAHECKFHRYHVAGPVYSCLEIARLLGVMLRRDFEVEWLTAEKRRPGYDWRYALSTERFDDKFTCMRVPTYGTDFGLRRTIEWVKRERSIKDEA